MEVQSSLVGTLFIRLFGSWAVLHGILVMLNTKERWSAPVFSAVNLLPGSPLTWGVLFVFAGILVMWASLKGVDLNIPGIGNKNHRSYKLVKNTGLRIIALTCFLFSLGVVAAVFQNPGVVSLSAADRDAYMCVAAILMMKIVEPRYKHESS